MRPRSSYKISKQDQNITATFIFCLLRYVQPPVIDFDAIYEQSTPFSPIIFILSPGSDPASDLMKLAERSGFEEKFQFLAMGQGQEKVMRDT